MHDCLGGAWWWRAVINALRGWLGQLTQRQPRCRHRPLAAQSRGKGLDRWEAYSAGVEWSDASTGGGPAPAAALQQHNAVTDASQGQGALSARAAVLLSKTAG